MWTVRVHTGFFSNSPASYSRNLQKKRQQMVHSVCERVKEYPSLYYVRPLADSDECAGLPSKQKRKHLSLRRRAAGHHYPIQQNPRDLFYRICFSIADGPLHMFSSHWSGVRGWLGCRYYIKSALRLHRVSPQILHTEERRIRRGQAAENTTSGEVWQPVSLQSVHDGR